MGKLEGLEKQPVDKKISTNSRHRFALIFGLDFLLEEEKIPARFFLILTIKTTKV